MRAGRFLLLILFSLDAGAAWHVESGPQQTLMVELFTSQGCSSCPPAEELLNRFADNPRLWTSFIPMAFHVDYWDYLGWKDRYALPDNQLRQRRYAQLGHVSGVYTPGFLVNGRGWRPGLFSRTPQLDERLAGELSVTLEDGQLSIAYQEEANGFQSPELHLAVLGMGLGTDIRAGENAGRHSRHEFVVLAHRLVAGEGPQWSTSLPAVGRKGARRLALVAWVSRPGDPTPVQAVGGYLPD